MNSKLPFTEEELLDVDSSAQALVNVDFANASPTVLSSSLIEKLLSGDMQFDDVVKLKKLEKTITTFLTSVQVKEKIIHWAEQYGKDNTMFGMRFTVKNSPIPYDYSACNHPGLDAAYRLRKNLNDYIIEVEKMLKSLPADKPTTIVIEQIPLETLTLIPSGETVEVLPPVKSSSKTVEWKTL